MSDDMKAYLIFLAIVFFAGIVSLLGLDYDRLIQAAILMAVITILVKQ